MIVSQFVTRTSLSAALVVLLCSVSFGAQIATADVAADDPHFSAVAYTTVDEPQRAGEELIGSHGNGAENSSNSSEEPFVEPVPEEGDPYFEASARDGSWVSYINPRDEYRSPYLGDGSGKICITLLNERGEVIVGRTVPNTTVTIPTGKSINWHPSADPVQVNLSLIRHYDRPLDADQFGVSPKLPQGDGYLDAHCVEFHGLRENASVEYGQATVDGEFANQIEIVGYVQQAHSSWNTSVDPIADAKSHEQAGGGWTYRPGESHGQVVVVLQLDRPHTAGPSASNSSERTGRNATQGNGAGEKWVNRVDESIDKPTERQSEDRSESADTDIARFATYLAFALLVTVLIVRIHR